MTSNSNNTDVALTLDIQADPITLENGVTVYESTATLRLGRSDISASDRLGLIKRVQEAVNGSVKYITYSLGEKTKSIGDEHQTVGDSMQYAGLVTKIDQTEGYWRATYFRIPLMASTVEKKVLVGADELMFRQLLINGLASKLGKVKQELEEEGWGKTEGSIDFASIGSEAEAGRVWLKTSEEGDSGLNTEFTDQPGREIMWKFRVGRVLPNN